MSDMRQWMESMCDPDSDRGLVRSPVRVADGAMGTDGQAAVWVQGEEAHEHPAIGSEQEGWFASVTGGRRVRLGVLREWAGEWEAPSPKCPECDGSGAGEKCVLCLGSGTCCCPECDDEHDCGACAGQGKKDCVACKGTGMKDRGRTAMERIRAAVISGVLVDRNLLAKALRACPVDGGAEVLVAMGGAEDPVRIFGDGWVVVVMPLRWPVEDCEVMFEGWKA